MEKSRLNVIDRSHAGLDAHRREVLRRHRRVVAALVVRIELRRGGIRVVALRDAQADDFPRGLLLRVEPVVQSVGHARHAADNRVRAVDSNDLIEDVDGSHSLDDDGRLDDVLELRGVGAVRLVEDPVEDGPRDPGLEVEEPAIDAVRHLDALAVETLRPVGVPPRHRRVHREKRPLRKRDPHHGIDVETCQSAILYGFSFLYRLVDLSDVLGVHAEVDLGLADRALATIERDPRQPTRAGQAVLVVEDVVLVDGGVQDVASPVARHVPANGPGAVVRLQNVLLIALLDREIRGVVDVRAGMQPRSELLRQPAAHREIRRRVRRLHAAVALLVIRSVLVQQVELGVAAVAAPELVPVFAPERLTGLRVPVVQERRVLAAVDRPEEGVAERLPADGGGSIDRDQKAGRPIVVLHRVIEGRQIHHGHALDPQGRVGQKSVVVDLQRHRSADHLPTRRRLNAGRKRAVYDLVRIGTKLVDLVAPEHGVRLLRAEHAAIDTVGHADGAGRVVERAGARLRVELEALGRDPVGLRLEQHVASRHDPMVVEHFHLVGGKVHVLAVDPHWPVGRAGQDHPHLFDALVVLHRKPDACQVLDVRVLAVRDVGIGLRRR